MGNPLLDVIWADNVWILSHTIVEEKYNVSKITAALNMKGMQLKPGSQKLLANDAAWTDYENQLRQRPGEQGHTAAELGAGEHQLAERRGRQRVCEAPRGGWAERVVAQVEHLHNGPQSEGVAARSLGDAFQ